MKLFRFAVPAFALIFGAATLATIPAQAMPASPVQGYGQDHGNWDAPPREFEEIQRRGFRDGIAGANRDFDNHRRPDVNNRDEYRNAGGPRRVREAYREGFRRGYDVAMGHLMGMPGRPMPEPEHRMAEPARPMPPQQMGDRDRWDAPPPEFREIQMRGYRDGIEGARRDYDNNRRPDPNNRDEYRHPNVPRDVAEQYRDAFRRGYERATAHLRGDHDRR